MLRWLFLLFLAVVAACTVAAWLPAQEPAKIELHVFCLPDKDCVYCRIFHADADQSPLKEVLAKWTVHHHSQFDSPAWSVNRWPTFIVASGTSQVRRHVGYPGPQKLIEFLGK